MTKIRKKQINIPKIGVFTIVITWIILLLAGIEVKIAFPIGGVLGIIVVIFLVWKFCPKDDELSDEKVENKKYINTFVRGPEPVFKKDSMHADREKK